MSCSQFIEHEEDKSDTLVIIVNGDGTVTVDPHTLERVLNQQRKAAVSVIRFENSNELDSQTKSVNADKIDNTTDKEQCPKVNLIVEGYYPPPTNNELNMSEGNGESFGDESTSIQTSSEFLSLLSESLDIPISQSPVHSDLQASGCVGDSLVDAFSEMAPEQLKQVETALHSEKAKQILGHDVTSVLDTLNLNEEIDDWVHLDHCYTTNIYSNRKVQNNQSRNISFQNCDISTNDVIIENVNNDVNSIVDTYEEICVTENNNSSDAVKTENENDADQLTTFMKKKDQLTNIRNKVNSAKNDSQDTTVKSTFSSLRAKRPINFAAKLKRKYTFKNEQNDSKVQRSEQFPPTRIVKDDEVDGVKVFKPTRNDKKVAKPFLISNENRSTIVSKPFIQTKLNFVKKEEPFSSLNKQPISRTTDKIENISIKESAISNRQRFDSTKENDDQVRKQKLKQDKKELIKKPPTSSKPELFGPALFSTPDIIRKINTDEVNFVKDNETMRTPLEHLSTDEQTAELEKRMLAIENGEVLLDQLFTKADNEQKEKYKSVTISDHDRLLSDLENSENEISPNEDNSFNSPITLKKSRNFDDSRSETQKILKKSNSSQNSSKEEAQYEDDPDRLWCICNKPHGNRFMICCDACDNWFHISCVGVSKAMAEKMEQNGIEWLCSSCKKEKSAKEREIKLKLSGKHIVPKSNGRQSLDSTNNSTNFTSDHSVSLSSNISLTEIRVPNSASTPSSRRKIALYTTKVAPIQMCIQCNEKEAMPEAMYCSGACIIHYVNSWLAVQNSNSIDPLPDDRKIIVYERKTDTVKTGLRAPEVGNIKQWLQQNPSYEIRKLSAFPIMRISPKEVRPSSSKSSDTKLANKLSSDTSMTHITKDKSSNNIRIKSNEHVKLLSSSFESIQSNNKQFLTKNSTSLSDDAKRIKKLEDSSFVKENTALSVLTNVKKDVISESKIKDKQRQIKLIPVQPLQKPVEEQKSLQPLVKKIVTQLSKEIDKDKKKKIEPIKKEKIVPKKVEIKRADSKEESNINEPITTVLAGPDPVRTNICKSLSELFASRLKDFTDIQPEDDLTTLATQIEEELFNIFKDTGAKYKSKYRSLLFNIKDQKNTLFRRIVEKTLTPFELVRLTPEELASTELAQWREREAKHEIDMIKKAELENLNQAKILVVKTHKGELEIESEGLPPKTDVIVPDLDSEIPEKEGKKSSSYYLSKEKNSSTDKETSSTKEMQSSSDKKDEKDRDRHKKQDHREKHKSRKHRRRSTERDQHGSKSRTRSKSSEKERRNRSRSRSNEKSHYSKSSDKSDHRSRSKRRRSHSRNRKHKDTSSATKDDSGLKMLLKLEKVMATTEEIDKIDDNGENTTEMILSYSNDNGDTNTGGDETTVTEDEKIAADLLSRYNSVDVDLSDMEPTSTVTIQTPPYAHSPESPLYLWKGILSMPDVGKFETMLKEVSGNCDGLEDDLNEYIDCVGRIHMSTVWDYILEIKKSGCKDILVLRFEVQDEEQRLIYLKLYSYLISKHRMAVVGNTGPEIKDFYVLPLAGHSPVPQILLPLDGPGFEDYRQNMLLAIIIRNRRQKYSSRETSSLTFSSYSTKASESQVYVPYGAVAVPSSKDEPDSFTPPHSPTSVYVNTRIPVTTAVPTNDEDEPYSPEDAYSPNDIEEEEETKRKMEELNRQIEEERQQIESMSSNLDQNTELYSPEQFMNSEANEEVKLPEDLQQLLNSFSKRSSNIDQRSPNDAAPVGANVSMGTDPIIDAYKKINSEDKTDDNENETSPASETCLSSSEVSNEKIKIDNDDVEIVETTKEDSDDSDDEEVMFVENELPIVTEKDKENVKEIITPRNDEVKSPILLPKLTNAEDVLPSEESMSTVKTSRDPRKKLVISLEPLRCVTPVSSAQPPPPGMEDEFGTPSGSVSETGDTPTKSTDLLMPPNSETAAYNTTAPYIYSASGTVPPYPPPLLAPPHPMYIASAPVFPQHPTLPFPSIPPPQMYIPPLPVAQVAPVNSVTNVIHHDPSIIPLPVEPAKDTVKKPDKRKALDEDDKDEVSRNGNVKKLDFKSKKHKFYSSDSKSASDTSPIRHKNSSSYDSHRRGYQRDDVEYSSSGHSSRYGYNKHGRSYHSSRSSRSSYWKDDRDSSHHRKYSHRSSSRERSSSRHNRWDGDHEKERDKSDHSSKKSESSKRS